MKVVLFCGGLGLRMGESSPRIPKPMVPIGGRPILWHIMKYYAHYGHTDFIVCLGHRGEAIKEYFLNYNEAMSNDFVLNGADRGVELITSDIDSWRITFLDTGLHASVGERLRLIRRHVEDEEIFLATYGDGVIDAPLTEHIETFRRSKKVAAFTAVPPSTYSFHTVVADDDGIVREIRSIARSDVWVNGGFFVFRSELFDYLQPGEDLVEEPFHRLIAEEQLLALRYDGFWAPMDTLKDKHMLDTMLGRGEAPWAVWQNESAVKARATRSADQ